MSISTTSTSGKTVINDLYVTITLGPDHGADETTWIKVDYDGAFIPSGIIVGTSEDLCLSPNVGCPIDKEYAEGDNLVVHFWYTYVKETSSDEN